MRTELHQRQRRRVLALTGERAVVIALVHMRKRSGFKRSMVHARSVAPCACGHPLDKSYSSWGRKTLYRHQICPPDRAQSCTRILSAMNEYRRTLLWMRRQERSGVGRALYYQIEGTNVRLAGSLHLVPGGATIPLWVVSAYQWSKEIYLENNTDTLPVHGFLPAGQSTQTRMPADLWAALNNAWPANHPLGPLDRQKFWLIAMVMAFAGVPLLLGVENFITRRTTTEPRSMRYLETLEEFAQIMEGISDTDYLNGLLSILKSPSETRAGNLSNLYVAWNTNKVDAISALVRASPIVQVPAAMRAVFEVRNTLWLSRITALFGSQKRTVIFVGAGHLVVGGGGLLAMLNGAEHATTLVLGTP